MNKTTEQVIITKEIQLNEAFLYFKDNQLQIWQGQLNEANSEDVVKDVFIRFNDCSVIVEYTPTPFRIYSYSHYDERYQSFGRVLSEDELYKFPPEFIKTKDVSIVKGFLIKKKFINQVKYLEYNVPIPLKQGRRLTQVTSDFCIRLNDKIMESVSNIKNLVII